MKYFVSLLLIASIASAGLIYQFDPNSVYVTNRGVAIFWEYELRPQSTTYGYIRMTNTPPAFASTAIDFTKMSNGLCVALTATESNLVNSMTQSNADWHVADNRTNLVQAAAQSLDGDGLEERVIRQFMLLTLDQINTLRARASLGIITTNQFKSVLTNAIWGEQ